LMPRERLAIEALQSPALLEIHAGHVLDHRVSSSRWPADNRLLRMARYVLDNLLASHRDRARVLGVEISDQQSNERAERDQSHEGRGHDRQQSPTIVAGVGFCFGLEQILLVPLQPL